MIGLLAAYYRRLDTPLMRLVDVLLSFPSILFGLAIAAVLGTGLTAPGAGAQRRRRAGRSPASRAARRTSVMQQEYMEAGRAVGPGRRAR